MHCFTALNPTARIQGACHRKWRELWALTLTTIVMEDSGLTELYGGCAGRLDHILVRKILSLLVQVHKHCYGDSRGSSVTSDTNGGVT